MQLLFGPEQRIMQTYYKDFLILKNIIKKATTAEIGVQADFEN
jgi:hypothetical protein